MEIPVDRNTPTKEIGGRLKASKIGASLLLAGLSGVTALARHTAANQGRGVPATRPPVAALATILTVDDVERTTGLKRIKPDRGRLGDDSVMVFPMSERFGDDLVDFDAVVATFLPSSLDWHKFIETLGQVSPVSGTGDEAYSDRDGQVILFSKGKSFVMMQSPLSPADQKPYLTQEQLQKLATIAASRLSAERSR